MNSSSQHLDHLVELQRCRHAIAVDDVTNVLDAASIPYKKSSNIQTAPSGVVGEDSAAEVIISVIARDYDKAQSVLEEDALESPLPDDHHLHHASDDELLEVVLLPDEWNSFDVAHARNILRKKGLSLSEKDLLSLKQIKIRDLEKGEGAAFYVLILGWFTSLLAPFIALFIGLHLFRNKNQSPLGSFHTYTLKTRIQGALISFISATILVLVISSLVYSWS